MLANHLQAETRQPAAEAQPAAQTGTAAKAGTASPTGGVAGYSHYLGPRLRQPPEQTGPLGLEVAIEDRDGRSMQSLHAALRRAQTGRGQARLLFFGASHVASDLFTGALRRALQQRFGNAGYGFVLPVPPWKSYHPRGIEVLGQMRRWQAEWVRADTEAPGMYGLGGVFLQTQRAGALAGLSIVEGAETRNAELLELFYLQQPGGGSFRVAIDGQPTAQVSTDAAQTGPAYFSRWLSDAPHRWELTAEGDGPVRLFGVVVERRAAGVIVDTLGVNGARARYQLMWEESLFVEHLRRRRPDLVVLAYGTNESGDDSPLGTYESQLRQVVARLRRSAPYASCLLIGPTDRPLREGGSFAERPRIAFVNQVQHRVALDHGCGFFDLFAFQGGPLSMVQWTSHDPPMAAPDHVHLNRKGYERLGQVLMAALLEGFE